jgi:hypothetical protein
MNYVQLYQSIQDYAETTEQLFVANIPRFVQEAEDRIYNSVQIPSLRKNVTGTLTLGNKYVSLPSDWLSNYSIAMIDASGNYQYLLNKDVNFIRASYPSATYQGTPAYYALFGSQYTDINEMSLILCPTPDANYTVEMHYYYYPPTIVQGEINTFAGSFTAGTLYVPGVYSDVSLTGGSGSSATATIVVNSVGGVASVTLTNGGQFYVAGDVLGASNSSLGGAGSGFAITVSTVTNSTGHSWLGDNYDPVLFYGAMREAMLFQRQEPDVIQNYEAKYQEALAQLKRLGDGLERGDAYREGQTRLPYNKL